MGWRSDEVWLDSEVFWFREGPGRTAPSLAVVLPSFAAYAPDVLTDVPLPPVRLTREERQRAARRRRLATRTVPAAALVIGSATMLSIAGLRQEDESRPTNALAEDPPSHTFRLSLTETEAAEAAIRRAAARVGASVAGRGIAAPEPKPLRRTQSRAAEIPMPEIDWNRASSRGLPYSGSLADGTQLPVEGPDWVTWNPVTDSTPNLPHRLYGNERTIRRILSVITAYRADHPDAPRVVVGDISYRDGGRMDEHVSHQNGLDVDVYYPRLDGNTSAPITPSQVDRAHSQDLLDRFVAAGAQMVFVGYSTGLQGPSGVVVPYANHENHMHVRFPPPPA